MISKQQKFEELNEVNKGSKADIHYRNSSKKDCIEKCLKLFK